VVRVIAPVSTCRALISIIVTGIFYGNVGTPLSDIPHLVEKMTTADQANRANEVAIASIYKAYYAFM